WRRRVGCAPTSRAALHVDAHGHPAVPCPVGWPDPARQCPEAACSPPVTALSHGDRRGDMRLRMIILHHEILDSMLEDTDWPPRDPQLRCASRAARELFFHQCGMIKIEVDVPAIPDDFA